MPNITQSRTKLGREEAGTLLRMAIETGDEATALGVAAMAQLDGMDKLGPPPGADADQEELDAYLARAKAMGTYVGMFTTACDYAAKAAKAKTKRNPANVENPKWENA